MEQPVKNYVITGGIHNSTNNGDDINVYADNLSEKGIEILRTKVATGALHDSGKVYEKPKCHPGTREAILKEIMNWVREPTCSHPILWQHGPAGSGKSSIAHSVAAMCKKDGLLAADFFFFRADKSLNNSERLMATLAYRIALAIPELRDSVGEAILRDPLIFSSSLESQLHALLIEPIGEAGFTETTPNAQLIILDGLDECGDWRAQEEIISVFSSALADSSLPFRFMIASRPEQGIKEAFRRESTKSLTWELVLDDKYDPDTDIKLFLKARFSDIKATHPAKRSLPSSWPSEEAVAFLVQKSSGQFIYASTVMKFIESRHCLPDDMLDIILKLKPRLNGNSPYAELDALYTHLFESVHNFEQVWQIFACVLFSKIDSTSEPGMIGRQLQLTPTVIENFLGFRLGQLQVALVDLHSVLHIPETEDTSPDTIRLLHASLPDFLSDKERSGNFFIDKGEAHAFLAQRCANTLFSDSPPFVEREYLIHGFAMHCSEAEPTQQLLRFLGEFSLKPWLDLRLRNRVVHHWFREEAGNQSSVDAFDGDVRRLFKWMQSRFPDAALYRQCIDEFDDWLRAQLVGPSKIPASRYLFASLALNNSIYDWKELSDVIDFKSSTTTSDWEVLNETLSLHGGEGNPRYGNRMAGPNAPDLPVYRFLWDQGRAKDFYPKISWFIDLGTLCLRNISKEKTVLPKLILLVTLQRIVSHLPMERDIFKLLLKYPLPDSLPVRDGFKVDPDYHKAFISIKKFMKNYKTGHPFEAEQVLEEITSEKERPLHASGSK